MTYTNDMIDALIAASIAAGSEIMAVYADPEHACAVKADASPVTEADTRAEAVILAALAAAYPSIPVVAEEEAAAGRLPTTLGRFFLVDPLDGTREFINRNGEFTVNIALIEDGAPVLGVVYAPAIGDLFAGSESGALRGQVTGGVLGTLSPIATRAAPHHLVAVGSRSHGSDETARWLGRFDVERFVSSGSSLKFCLVAAGEADIYPRFGRTMEWDTAAGDAVLRAAGGIVADLDGRPVTYNKRDQGADVDFANGHFVAYGDPSLLVRQKESMA
jgi:3'(2'),5'-bisphosphate nucleotidase